MSKEEMPKDWNDQDYKHDHYGSSIHDVTTGVCMCKECGQEFKGSIKRTVCQTCSYKLPLIADLQWQWVTDWQQHLAHRDVGYRIGDFPGATYIRKDEYDKIYSSQESINNTLKQQDELIKKQRDVCRHVLSVLLTMMIEKESFEEQAKVCGFTDDLLKHVREIAYK